MSEPTTPDPAVSPPADGGFPLRDRWDHSNDGRAGGLVAAVAARWWVVAGAVALALLVALVWCLAATPLYTSTVVFAVERTRPQTANDLPPDELLAAQRAIFLSTPVLSAAAPAGMPSPAEVLRDQLVIETDKGQGTMTVRLQSFKPEQAAVTLKALADAYLHASGQQHNAVSDNLSDLSADRDRKEAARSAADKALRDFRASARVASDAGDASPTAAAARSQQLAAALSAAQSDAAKAKAEYDRVVPMLSDPGKANELVLARRSSGIFEAIDQQRAQVRKDLDAMEPTLAQQKQTLGAQHPALLQTQRKIDALNQKLAEIDQQYPQAYRAYLEQQRDSTQRKADELKALVDQQDKSAKESGAASGQLAELDAEAKRAEEALTEADKKLRQRIAAGDGSGFVMKLAQPPTVPSHPTSPDRSKIVIGSAIVGLVIGVALAAALGRTR